MKTRSLVMLFAALVVVPSASAQVTIDFSTFSSGSNLTGINNWNIDITLDGAGNISGVTESSGAGVNVANGITVSGTVGAGIGGSFSITMDGTNANAVDTTLRMNGNGTGVGVTGRNAGRIDWNPGSGDGQSEVIDLFVDTTSLTGGSSLVIEEMGLLNLDPPADPEVVDFDAISNVFAEGTSTLTLGGSGFTLDPGDTGTIFLSDSSDNGVAAAQGFSLGSITFDFVVPTLPELVIDRSTGMGTLTNTSAAAIDVVGYSILSDAGSLSGSGWTSVTDNYDANSGGSFDAINNWFILNSDANDLSESTFGATAPSMAVSDSLDVGQVYVPGMPEDLTSEILTDPSGSIVPVAVSYVGDVIDADFDNNGIVNGDDFLIWQTNYPIASGATNAVGDANGDGLVDGSDLEALTLAYGSTPPVLAASAAVPEPSAICLVLMAGVAGFAVRRR